MDNEAKVMNRWLVALGARFDEQGKVAACVREVLAVRQRTEAFRGAQLVFCDLSSPKEGKAFSVYDDLKQRLIDAEVPAAEIAFVHDADTDAQKATLFKAVREGRIDYTESGRLLRFYEEGLYGYTYLEDAG